MKHRNQNLRFPTGLTKPATGRVCSYMILLALSLLLLDCGSAKNPSNSLEIHGSVRGGQQPISGSSIQLYAAGKTGTGSPARALLEKAVQTDSAGHFSISGLRNCPSPNSEFYILAIGGHSS